MNAWTFLEKTKDLQSLLILVGIPTGLRERRLQPESPLLKAQQETGKNLHEKGAPIGGRKLYICPHTPVALIIDDEMLFFKSSIHIPDRMYDESGFTLIRMRSTPQPRRIYHHSELNNVTQRQPKLYYLLNTLDRLRIMQRQNYN